MLIRPERRDDHAALGELLRECFPGEPVDALVDVLRGGPTYLPDLALVAQDDDRLAGFVLLTTVTVEARGDDGYEARPEALCLAPLAVHPAMSGRGVARALVAEALARAASRGLERHVVLEGDPALYSRFGFVPADTVGLVPPSERIPPGAFQVHPLPGAGPARTGRVLYSPPFWEVVTPGQPVEEVTHLDELERQCRALESAVADPATLGVPVMACPGWTVGDVLGHLADVHRLVLAWLAAGRRPRRVPPPLDDAEPVLQFARGWRALHARLGAEPKDAAAPTWCAFDATVGFWRRRMAHEHAVHTGDVLEALERPRQVPDDIALDGVDESLRLWLGTRSGVHVGGTGEAVRLQAATTDGEPLRHWTVVRHTGVVEVLDGDVPAEATVTGAPSELYRWVWGRPGLVQADGQVEAVADLRAALRRVAS